MSEHAGNITNALIQVASSKAAITASTTASIGVVAAKEAPQVFNTLTSTPSWFFPSLSWVELFSIIAATFITCQLIVLLIAQGIKINNFFKERRSQDAPKN